MKNIPIFSLLTRTALGKLTYFFESKRIAHHSFLYSEGDPADFVYIIKTGEFQVTKRIIRVNQKEENINDILDNPLKANKLATKFFNRNMIRTVQLINLFIVGSGNCLGDDDVILYEQYQTSARCISEHADVVFIKKDDFIRL